MTGPIGLSGQRILVVEDDYYLAVDATRALEEAGAEIIGPFPTEEAALDAIAAAPPTNALLDINLRGERSFGVARKLQQDGIPFTFITGYDDDAIPPEFAHVIRLQKPVPLRRIIAALAEAPAKGN